MGVAADPIVVKRLRTSPGATNICAVFMIASRRHLSVAVRIESETSSSSRAIASS